jgi:phenylacetate-coenzyme A ligase PaaK-like adenylate-forming protein
VKVDTMWDPTAERMSADQRADLQARRLDDLLGRLAEGSPLYRERLAGAGIGPGARVGLDGLADLPFTTKQDLWDAYPWGLLAIPREQVLRVHGSSGTGGRPTLVAYSRADLELWAEVCARALGCAGAVPGTIVHNAYGYGLFTGGLGMHAGAELLGCTLVPVSGGQTQRQVTLIRDLRPEVLCCTPSYAAWLGEALGEAGMARGELVFTTLTKEAMPLLRYRTGDVASLDRSACACGRTLARMSKVTGRRDDMVVIRGVNVYPGEVEAVLVAERAVAPHYLLVVDRIGTMPRLVVACELAAGWTICAETEEAERDRVAGEIGAALLRRLGLATQVRVLPAGVIPRTELGKARRVAERTAQDNPLPGWL